MTLGKKKPGRPSNNEIKRSEILSKAAACFTLSGYNKTTLDEIGDVLGFNKAALYYYFKNKEELFTEVMKNELIKLREKLKLDTEQVIGFENKMVKYFDTRTEGWIHIVKINGLSKDNLINLNTSFSAAIMSFRNDELTYLKTILNQENSSYSNVEKNDFLNLLLDIQAAITMSAILLDNIDKDIKKMNETKYRKRLLLKHFLNSFATNYLAKK